MRGEVFDLPVGSAVSGIRTHRETGCRLRVDFTRSGCGPQDGSGLTWVNAPSSPTADACGMGGTLTIDGLRQRIADYRHLRTVTRDKKMLEVIDRIIAETGAELKRRGYAYVVD